MLIKKDEVFTLTHDLDERNRPMLALQDFDLIAVSNEIVSGMSELETAAEAWTLIERFEDLGLAKPFQQTLIRIRPGSGQILAEVVHEPPRITEPPQSLV